MNKGKYVVLNIEEFLYRLTAYLGVDVNLVYQNCYVGDDIMNASEDDVIKNNTFCIEISNENVSEKDIPLIVNRMVGDNTKVLNRAKSEMNRTNKMSFNMKECTKMFTVVFDIQLLQYISKYVVIDDDLIYLFYKVGMSPDILMLFEYKCECGETFGISNKEQTFPDVYIKHCPYCGINVENKIKKMLISKYEYLVYEIE